MPRVKRMMPMVVGELRPMGMKLPSGLRRTLGMIERKRPKRIVKVAV